MVLYYIHDPMCGWCWGFRSTWQKIQEALAESAESAESAKSIEIKYLLGGLAPDSSDPMPDAMKTEIEGYWKRIQQHIPETQFNYDFWRNCRPRRSTYPACRAVIAARKQNPEIERRMIEGIQRAYYLNAQNPSDDETLIEIAESLSLDGTLFSADLNAEDTQAQLSKEIRFSQEIGARGFPSMILEDGGEYQYVPLDYNNPASALAFINDKK